ncbi:MAG: helix-turn-helix transcriptional regulator [Sulfuricaulis sp.]
MSHEFESSAPSTDAGQVPLKILRMPATCAKLSTSKSSVYRMVADGTLPRPIKISQRAIGFFEHELDQFLLTRARATGAKDGQ